jgi:hypothetical protein
VKYYVPKNCAVGGRNFDSDSRSPADRKLWRQYFARILRIARNIHHRRFFPEQEEEVAGIEQMNEVAIQDAFVGIEISLARYCCCCFAFLELSPLTRTTQFR